MSGRMKMKLIRRLFFVILTWSTFCQASTDDLEEGSKQFVSYLIAKGDFETARIFLSRFSSSGAGADFDETATSVTVDETLLDTLRYAQKRILPDHQVCLSVGDLECGSFKCPPQNVFEIDLSDMDMVGGLVDRVVEYFTTQPLCNLRWLKLPTDAAAILVERIFPNNNSKRKYISLHRITASEGLAEVDLDRIFDHFSGYGDFVRDMSQISGRYDCAAAFLSVDGITLQAGSKYARGRIDNDIKPEGHTIHYRVGETSTRTAPFIMSVGR